MENYTKGDVHEVEDGPVFTLGEMDITMRVSGGSKIRNLMGYAIKKMKEPDTRQICWTGSDNAITKTVTCAEIMKRKVKGLHQISKVRYRRVEELWEPKIEGLERLKVNRDIPAMSILLSKDLLDKDEPGYQPPGSFDEFWKDVVKNDKYPTKQKNRQRQWNRDSQNGDKNKAANKTDKESRNSKKRGLDKSKDSATNNTKGNRKAVKMETSEES